MESGTLIVKVGMANYTLPVEGAQVTIKDSNGQTLHTQITDASGLAEPITLYAPNRSHTLDPNYHGAYYSTYQVIVSAPGFITEIINGVQIFDGEEAVQEVNLFSILESEPSDNVIDVPPHEQVLNTAHGPQALNAARSPQASQRSSPARRVFIPDFITVHLGRFNVPARNVRVPFSDYVKNVASSEIFPTWPPASLEANIRAIINFALNRIYTEWYRSRNYNFDITSSTTTDQYFVYGRDIFTSISVIVDRVMGEYLRRPQHNEPFFTEYCNGTTATCPGMSQWGTVTLANNGMNALQILRHYYPNDLTIFTAPIAAVTESYPGTPLTQGTQGPDVEIMQRYLNRIRQNFPAIPAISNPNGIYGSDTANSVRVFQRVFNLPQTGVIDRATWNRISFYFVSVSKLAELTSEGHRIVTGTTPPNVTIRMGSSGGLVSRLQFMITYIAQFYPEIPELFRDGSFGSGTRNAVIAFQNRFGLTADGIVGPTTWARLYEVYYGIEGVIPQPPQPPQPPPVGPAYPGIPLRVGSRGDSVALMQQYLNALAGAFPSIPRLNADGVFGPITESAVIAFQRQFGLTADGIIGPSTWNAIVTQYNNLPNIGPAFPGTLLRVGSRGESVRLMQQYLNALAAVYPSIPRLNADGVFGPITQSAVIAFQRLFGLTQDGIIGPITWNAIVTQYNNISTAPPSAAPPYPGTPLRQGSSGENVRVLQTFINRLADTNPSVPRLTADGIFGPMTRASVIAAQRLFGLAQDGIVGPLTWAAIVR